MSLGVSEILLILVVVLVLFGGKRIPELARALGKAQYEYNIRPEKCGIVCYGGFADTK